MVESTICMLLEEYCASRNLDAVKIVNNIRDAVVSVNEDCGKYLANN